MGVYGIIFYNSFQAAIIISWSSENAWFAAREFGGYNMPLATLMAVIGSTLGMGFNFGLGYYASHLKDKWFHFSDELYERLEIYFKHYVVYLLILPPISFIPFAPILATAVGLFHVHPLKAMIVILAGRILYYSYFLY